MRWLTDDWIGFVSGGALGGAAIAILTAGAVVGCSPSASERANEPNWQMISTLIRPDLGLPLRAGTDQDILVIGDSMVKWTPDLWTVRSFPGQPTPIIRAGLELELRQRSYSSIVLWPGTAHFMYGGADGQYLTDVRAMVQVALAAGARVAVVSPRQDMPGAAAAWERLRKTIAVPTVDFECVPLMASDTFADGIHVTQSGAYAVVATALQLALSSDQRASALSAAMMRPEQSAT